LLLTGVRTGELRSATPEQFELERGLWISENTLNGALKRMGYKDQLTGHGIRATISTALNEIGYNTKWIGAQLSHADPHQVSAAYNHAEYVEQRRHMMQDWADRLDQWESQGEQEAVDMSAFEALQINVPQSFPAGSENPVRGDAKTVDTARHEVVFGPDTLLTPRPTMTIVSRTDQRSQPVLTDIQRERAMMLAIFEAPHNLPLAVFAKLAGKSRPQINREIEGRRLLSLAMGNRGQRIPDWQLDPVRQEFIQSVLRRANGVDGWAIYRALSEPYEVLEGRSPVEAITAYNLREVASAVLGALGLN